MTPARYLYEGEYLTAKEAAQVAPYNEKWLLTALRAGCTDREALDARWKANQAKAKAAGRQFSIKGFGRGG